MRKNLCKRIIACSILSCFLFTACTVKEEGKKEPVQEKTANETNEDETSGEEQPGGMATDFGDVIVKDDYVELEYMYEPFPKGRETVVLAFQDGVPVPFAFESDGEYKTVQRRTFEDKMESSIYIKAQSFKKGDKISFGMGYVMEPDYMPEIQETTSYSPHQFTAAASKTFTMTDDFSGETNKNVLKDVEWKSYDVDESKGRGGYIMENDDMEVLNDIMAGKLINDLKVIQVSGEKTLRIYYMLKADQTSGFSGKVTFFLDHEPLKFNGDQDAFTITPPDHGYQVAVFDVTLPEGIKPGRHTFYSWAVGEGVDMYTSKRVLNYEE